MFFHKKRCGVPQTTTMNSGKVLLSVLAGVAAGAMAGILFAPEKGARTRRQIVNKGEDYAEGLKDKFDEFVDSLNKKYQTKIKEVEGLVSRGKSKYDSAVQEVDSIVANGKAKYEGAKSEVA